MIYDLATKVSPYQTTESQCITATKIPTSEALDGRYTNEQVESGIIMSVAQVITPTAPIRVGELPSEELSKHIADVTQVWIKQPNDPKPFPLLWTPLRYNYDLSPDGKSIVIDSVCYGVVIGQGMYSVDIQSQQVVTLHPTITHNCEGSIGTKISPNSKHILFWASQGLVLSTLKGEHLMQLCDSGEAQDYTWSLDGRFAYVACADQGIVRIQRIDTITYTNIDAMIGHPFSIKPYSMAVSPDGKLIAFYRIDHSIFEKKHEGVWILRLNRADP